MEEKEKRRKITIPLFSNSSQGSQAHFHYLLLHYYMLRFLCLSQVKYKKKGKKCILMIICCKTDKTMVFYKSGTVTTAITPFDFMLFPRAFPGL